MPQPQFAIAVTFEIKPESIELFRRRVLQQAKDSVEREPGCLQFDVLQEEACETTIHLYETYVDAEAFVVHRQTPHFADFDMTVRDWIVSKQVRRLTMLEGNTKKLA